MAPEGFVTITVRTSTLEAVKELRRTLLQFGLRVIGQVADDDMSFSLPDIVDLAVTTMRRQIYKREEHRVSTRMGVERAQRKGVHIGRSAADIDLTEARRMLRQGKSLRAIATHLKISRTTLGRVLAPDYVAKIEAEITEPKKRQRRKS